jgi:hypothetical protein
MKALLSTIVILSYCSLAVAQINRGNFMLGGNITAHHDLVKSSSSTGKYTNTSVSNNATAAYFAGKNFCVGFALPFELQSYKYGDPSFETYTSTTYGIKPFVRYYIPVASSIFILTEGMGIFTHTTDKLKYEYDGLTENSKSSGTNVGFSAGTGLAFRLNNHALLELLGNYQYTKSNNKNENLPSAAKSTNNRLFLSVGFNFLLPGK